MCDVRCDTLICSKSLGHTVTRTSIKQNSSLNSQPHGQYHSYLIDFPDATSLTTSHEQDELERDRQSSFEYTHRLIGLTIKFPGPGRRVLIRKV